MITKGLGVESYQHCMLRFMIRRTFFQFRSDGGYSSSNNLFLFLVFARRAYSLVFFFHFSLCLFYHASFFILLPTDIILCHFFYRYVEHSVLFVPTFHFSCVRSGLVPHAFLQVDMYSYGVVLWELCSLQKPFAGMSPYQHARKVSVVAVADMPTWHIRNPSFHQKRKKKHLTPL